MSMKTIHLRALVGALALVLAVTVATPALAQGGAKIAIVDTQRILAQSSTGQAAQAEMEELRDAKTAEGQALQQEIEALRTRLNEGRLTLAEDAIANLEQQLEDKAIELRRFQDDANRELQKKQAAVLQQFEASVMPVINAVGSEQGYSLIFSKFESGLLYADDSVEITDEVISRLDAANN